MFCLEHWQVVSFFYSLSHFFHLEDKLVLIVINGNVNSVCSTFSNFYSASESSTKHQALVSEEILHPLGPCSETIPKSAYQSMVGLQRLCSETIL